MLDFQLGSDDKVFRVLRLVLRGIGFSRFQSNAVYIKPFLLLAGTREYF